MIWKRVLTIDGHSENLRGAQVPPRLHDSGWAQRSYRAEGDRAPIRSVRKHVLSRGYFTSFRM